MEGMEGEQILKHSLYLSLLPSHPPVFQPESFALRPRLWPTYHGYQSSIGRGNLKRQGGTWDEHTVRKDNVKAWQEDSQLQAKERGLRGSQPCRHLDCGLLVSRIMIKQIPVCCGRSGWLKPDSSKKKEGDTLIDLKKKMSMKMCLQ
nr:uncharacterized protein LOC105720000 [Aotus nancymaae]